MVHPALVAVGIGVGAKVLERLNTSPHDRLLEKATKQVDKARVGEGSLYVDHISTRRADGNPDGVVDDVGGVPDIVLKDWPTHMIVEVEDAEGLQDPDHVLGQLRDYQSDGYRNVLVVPDAQETVELGEELADRVDGAITVTTPGEIGQYV